MSALTTDDLQELAAGSWRKARPLDLSLWRELAQRGLYHGSAAELGVAS